MTVYRRSHLVNETKRKFLIALELPAVQTLIDQLPVGVALDVAYGTGRQSRYLITLIVFASASAACSFDMHLQNLTHHFRSPRPTDAAFGGNAKLTHGFACHLHPA